MVKKKYSWEYYGKSSGKCPNCGYMIEFGEATRFVGNVKCSKCWRRFKIEELEDLSLWMPANEYFSIEEEGP